MSAFIWGVCAGLFYFGGLRWTIKDLSVSRRPRAKVALSFWLRLLLLLGLMSRLDLTASLLFLLGFFGLRNVLVSRWS